MSKQIQWYPGHMAKSIRQLKDEIKLVDVVIILVDSRCPYSSMNNNLLKISENKEILLIFNKYDMTDTNILNLWEKYYKSKGFHTLKINSFNKNMVSKIVVKIKNEILKEKIEKLNKKGLIKNIFRTMVLGIPNVGKSSLINSLSNKKIAKVENRPGVTKNLTWTRLNQNLELLDTPGILPPKLDDKTKYNLAIFGAIKDDILPIDDICLYIYQYMIKFYPNRLSNYYNVDENTTYVQFLEDIGRKIGAIYKNSNEFDYNRIYQMLLKDIRSQKLGGLCFERPNDI